MNTPNFLINEQTRKTEYGKNIFFIYHMKNERLVDFLICYKKDWKYDIYILKKLSEHARLLGSSE